jgi:hypothetical protein
MNTNNADAMTDISNEEAAMTTSWPVKQRYIAPTVEECPAIEVKLFRNRKKEWDRGGELTWMGQRSGRVMMTVRYRVIGIPEADLDRKNAGDLYHDPLLAISTGGTTQTIRLRACAGGFGGTRYFFACPMCLRNYRKLFLSPGKLEFACRRCEGLRYTSQRRDLDFFLKPIAAKTGAKRRIVRKYLEKSWEAAWQLERRNEVQREQG